MEEDIIKVVRLYEFTGPRSVIEKQISKSVHGEQIHGKVTINAYTLGTWPEIIEAAKSRAEILGYDKLARDIEDRD